tara:strand:- start:885 stop:1103 length:219 start_codon:yes stop_codon:yes gene_type:complete
MKVLNFGAIREGEFFKSASRTGESVFKKVSRTRITFPDGEKLVYNAISRSSYWNAGTLHLFQPSAKVQKLPG